MPVKNDKKLSSYLIDITVPVALTIFMYTTVINFVQFYFKDVTQLQTTYMIFSLYKSVAPVLVLNTFGYFFLVNYWGEGRSVGGFFCDLTASSNCNSKSMTFKQAFLRSTFQTAYLIGLASIVCIPLFLIPVFRKDNATIGDLLSKTTVINLDDSFDRHFTTEFSKNDFESVMLLEHLPVIENVLPFPDSTSESCEETEEKLAA